MKFNVEELKSKEKLRTGFTTGTASTASSKAAILAIINQKKMDSVDVTLPKGNSISIKIQSCIESIHGFFGFTFFFQIILNF